LEKEIIKDRRAKKGRRRKRKKKMGDELSKNWRSQTPSKGSKKRQKKKKLEGARIGLRLDPLKWGVQRA